MIGLTVAFFGWGGGLELGSGVQISKLALGLVMGLSALMGPILKFERPTPIRWRGDHSMSSVFSFSVERDLVGRSRRMGGVCLLLTCEPLIKMFMLVNLRGEGMLSKCL